MYKDFPKERLVDNVYYTADHKIRAPTLLGKQFICQYYWDKYRIIIELADGFEHAFALIARNHTYAYRYGIVINTTIDNDFAHHVPAIVYGNTVYFSDSVCNYKYMPMNVDNKRFTIIYDNNCVPRQLDNKSCIMDAFVFIKYTLLNKPAYELTHQNSKIKQDAVNYTVCASGRRYTSDDSDQSEQQICMYENTYLLNKAYKFFPESESESESESED